VPQENRTLTVESDESQLYLERTIRLNSSANPEEVLDRTINQDFFDAIDKLPEGFVDLLFIDPPYNMDKDFGAFSMKAKDDESYEEYVESFLVPCLRLLKPGASVYVCGDWRSSGALYRVLSRYLTVRNRITWEREKGRGAKANWKNASEDIFFATKGNDFYFDVEAVKLKKRVIAPYTDPTGQPKDWESTEDGRFRLTHPSNIWTDLTVPYWSMPENTDHPTHKPEKLLAKIILSGCPEGGLFLTLSSEAEQQVL
jgi:site-specific DNA-methyltransferase (adenine-specific)